ncbi:Regulatory protein cys-3 [Penicillium longicatenatum]|nr:Regulatory protein cys-3 [Penicillium longicatenatum]
MAAWFDRGLTCTSSPPPLSYVEPWSLFDANYDRVHGPGGSLDRVADLSLPSLRMNLSMILNLSLNQDQCLLHSSAPTGDKSINYSIPDHMMPYSAHSIYPPVPFAPDELGHAPGNMTPSDVSSSISPPNGQMGNTKYSTSIPGDRIAAALGQEEGVRYAAEEDRRRRNTAASARFRMKKKQREQVLERTVRETTEKNASLEARVAQLEMENRWLKNLLTEKHEASARMPPPPLDSGALEPKAAAGRGQKHIQPKKKGVGTDE